MEIISHNTQTAFISVNDGEEFPDEILITVDRKRKFKKYFCDNCNRIFYSRIENKYCSRKCLAETRNVILVCPVCNKSFTKKLSALHSKSGYYFCSRKCKEIAQSVDSNFKKIRPTHYLDGWSRYASRAKRKQMFCDICGESNKDFLIVHHIDENRENNALENLRVLCANCHVKGHRTGIWNK